MSIQIFFLTEIQDHPIKCSEATTYEASYFWFQTKYETSQNDHIRCNPKLYMFKNGGQT